MPSFVEPVGLREIGPVVAVVEQIADADVAQAVELRADLAELAADDLVVIHRAVRADRPERLRNPQAVVARAEQRHRRLVDVAELIDRAARDQVLRLEHLRGRDAVCRAALIGGAPARRIPVVRLAESHAGCSCDAQNGEDGNQPTTTHTNPLL